MQGWRREFLACNTGLSMIGNLLMIMLTVLLFGAVAYFLIGFHPPEKAPVTGFDVTPHNASVLRIMSLAGSPIPADTAKITLGTTLFDLSGLEDGNGNGMLDPGEIAFVGSYDLTQPTRVVIASGNYLLLEIEVLYRMAGAQNGSAPVPEYAPGIVATYYDDEVWSSPVATAITGRIRYADDAGAGAGYPGDELHWPVGKVGSDERFSVKFDGLIRIDQEADYTFYLTSDDGSFLSINGSQVVDNGGLHSPRERTGTVHLAAGYHPITVHMFEHTGNAVIRLEYSSPNISRSFVTALYHLPAAPPVADFSAVPTVANAPATVQFTDLSTGASAWAWDFGDGSTSDQQNPAHTYSANGDYTVRLTATNTLGSGTIAKAGYIKLGSAVPGYTTTYYSDEAWSAPVATRTAGRIRFADAAGIAAGYASDASQWPIAETGKDEGFSVKFGGTLKVDQEADYTFYLTSDDGSFLSIDGSQVVDNGGLHSPAERTGTVHLATGYHAIEVRMFDHTGNAVIRLEYSSPAMPRTYVTSVYHEAILPPDADFSAAPTLASPPAQVQFTDRSSDATAWAWDFGDGGTSALQNPAHTYSAIGDYTVRLTASNAVGSDTETKSQYIRIGLLAQGFNATYYSDEAWTARAGSETVAQVRFADPAGVSAGYASDRAGWPAHILGKDEGFSVRFEGSLKIDQEADYTFYLTSDDGSFLSIDGSQVVDNGGLHSPRERTGTVHLATGYHAIEVRMFDHTGNAVIRLEYSSPAMPRKFVQEAYTL